MQCSSRHAALLVLTALTFDVAVTSAQQRGRPVRVPPAMEQSILAVLGSYTDGDDQAIERWLSTPKLTQSVARYVEAVLTQNKRPWNRSTPAFVLEVATRLMDSTGYAVPDLLKLGWNLMLSRPTPLGADASEDRFELLWHQTALAIAQGLRQYWLQQDHLDLLRLRFPEPQFREQLIAIRLPLARAIAAGGLCCWKREPGEMNQRVPPSERRPVTVDEAVRLFSDAAAIPDLHVEALIRGAVLLHKVGRFREALVWFDRIPVHDDRTLAYVQHFTHGRLLDATDRAADAAAAYRAALDAEPNRQVAGIGLAAALLRAGRVDDAVAVAAEVRQMPGEKLDHDQAFRKADARFVPAWLVEIRKLRR